MLSIEKYGNYFYSNVYQEPLLPLLAVMKEHMAFEWKMEIRVEADQSHAVRIIPVFSNCKVTTKSFLCVPFRHVGQW